MSKKFDEEYRAAFENSTPDLWERIEKNLDENLVREMPKKKKKKYSDIITYVALPVAALALALVLIPLAMGRMGSDNAATEAAMNLTAYDVDGFERSENESYMEETTEECVEEAFFEEESAEDMDCGTNEEVGAEIGTSDSSEGVSEECTPQDADTSGSSSNTVFIEGTITLVSYDEDFLPDISIQELGYYYVYIARVVDITGMDAETEIMLYTTEELPINNELLQVQLVENESGYLLVNK